MKVQPWDLPSCPSPPSCRCQLIPVGKSIFSRKREDPGCTAPGHKTFPHLEQIVSHGRRSLWRRDRLLMGGVVLESGAPDADRCVCDGDCKCKKWAPSGSAAFAPALKNVHLFHRGPSILLSVLSFGSHAPTSPVCLARC